MWINLQGRNINFDLIEEFHRDKANICLRDLDGDTKYVHYTSESKAKQVEKYIMNKLNSKVENEQEDK